MTQNLENAPKVKATKKTIFKAKSFDGKNVKVSVQDDSLSAFKIIDADVSIDTYIDIDNNCEHDKDFTIIFGNINSFIITVKFKKKHRKSVGFHIQRFY